MKHYKWIVCVGLALVCTSTALYALHYLIFRDAHHILIYLVGDIAFLPIEVFLVAVILERLLARHEKTSMLKKLNMVIGTFFSEVGTQLLGELAHSIDDKEDLKKTLAISSDWADKEFKTAAEAVRNFQYKVDAARVNLSDLKEMLAGKRHILLMLLGNPNLLEHEHFTNTLWAVFHLMEELQARESLKDLPPTDLAHLAGDIERAYSRLTVEWLNYCRHLKKSYPYIFSIIVRTHPLQDNPSATVV
ncbi:MAG: hypothetical protein HQ592_15450 [Planctomycetes bacterium]|nr:hypothetical protein [Planctomycetota bacterium]